MRYWRPTHFAIEELVPKRFLEAVGEARAWLAIDPRILWTLDEVRSYYGKPITINDWARGGKWSQRGLRTECNPATPTSQHYYGRAVDFVIKGISAAQFRRDVRSGALDKAMTYITAIEDGVSWCHVDCRAIPGTEILFFKQT